MQRCGFTRLELAVVLAAVVLLAVILFPLLARRRAERDVQLSQGCQSNLRQIGAAIKLYLSDYDGWYPKVNPPGAYGWAEATYPYLRSFQALQCKGDPTPLMTVIPTGSDPDYTDYFYNAHLGRQNESALPVNFAGVLVAGDGRPGNARRHSTGGTSKQPGSATLVDGSGASVGAAMRHTGGANYLFADEHMQRLIGTDDNSCPAIKNAAAGAWPGVPGFAVD